MKKNLLLLIAAFALIQLTQAQTNTLPNVQLKDLNGKTIETGKLLNDGKPILICFWATWCAPCKKELNAYAELYEQWAEETGVKIYAVSIDDQRTSSSVKPFVNSVNWEYEVLMDVNKAFFQALGGNTPPHTFLLNGAGEIVWQHVGYTSGDEAEVHEQLVKLNVK